MLGILDRLFGFPEEINGGERCPTYLYHWTISRWRGRGVYLHRFIGDDWTLDQHDHPKRFISIGLWGQYREDLPSSTKIYRAPWIRSFPATHIHRISMVDNRECWTICIVLKPVRSWGFWADGEFVGWREYVKSKRADEMKACPGGSDAGDL